MKSDERETLTIARLDIPPAREGPNTTRFLPSSRVATCEAYMYARDMYRFREEHARSLSLSLSFSREIDRLWEETFTPRRLVCIALNPPSCMRANFHWRVANKRGT